MSDIYRKVQADPFPDQIEIRLGSGPQAQTIHYRKVTWQVADQELGLRYGENPDQPAALYRPLDANIQLADAVPIALGGDLVSSVELLRSGKHPSKTNLTDVDSALGVLRFLSDRPCCVVVKHNNPSGVALGRSISEAFARAWNADPIAAFGGAVVVNRPVDLATADALEDRYIEVLAAPEFEPGVLDRLAGKKNLRIVQIRALERLANYATARYLDFHSLVDGGLVSQLSYLPLDAREGQFAVASATRKGTTHTVDRAPTEAEWDDIRFGWYVQSAVISNSVLYVKGGCTLAVGAGEQDRVGVATLARDKALRNAAERIARTEHGTSFAQLIDPSARAEIEQSVQRDNGGLVGATMVSDGFFPFRDGIDVGLDAGVRCVVQPGGSLRDAEVIAACNERNATMVFTGQRSFRH